MRLLRAIAFGLASCFLLLPASSVLAQEVDYTRIFETSLRADGRPVQGTYWVSVPFLPDIPDVANTAAPEVNKCVGDRSGPASPDGIINVDDLICHWWTDRLATTSSSNSSTFSVHVAVPEECYFVFRAAYIFLGTPRFSGSIISLDPTTGLQVLVTVGVGINSLARNEARVVGDNDDAWAGQVLAYAPTCVGDQRVDCCSSTARRLDFIALPHDALVTTADEILCGLEGVDWSDMNGDGRPDTCWEDSDGDRAWDPGEAPTGIFDGRTTISVYDLHQVPGQYAQQVGRHVMHRLGRLFFLGVNFPVEPGDAYLVELQRGHQPTLWRPATN